MDILEEVTLDMNDDMVFCTWGKNQEGDNIL